MSDTTFHIAILGDFSGRALNGRSEPGTIGKRRLIAVDRDNYEDVLGQFDSQLQLPAAGQATQTHSIAIKTIDDFHPDQLYQTVEVFAHLRDLRQRLKNNGTFHQAAAELQTWAIPVTTASARQAQTPPAATTSAINLESLLDSVVSTARQDNADAVSQSGSALVDRLIRQIVAPYIEPAADPGQDDMIAAVDAAIAAHMRHVLHYPQYQALEAAWRSIEFLVRRITTGTNLKIFLLDISKTELDSDLAVDDVGGSGLHKLFCDPSPGGLQFDLLLGNYRFDASIDDVLLLAQLGKVAGQAGAVFLAGAHERLAGCESFAQAPDVDDWRYVMSAGVAQAWSMLRASPVAANLALCVPRVLLRIPYGKKSGSVEAFNFEELPAQHCHECYLWGNGAFVVAEQLARAFNEQRKINETDGFPVHYSDNAGEHAVMPCAEILLTERGGRKIQQQGLIALWSVKNSDAIRTSEFISLAGS